MTNFEYWLTIVFRARDGWASFGMSREDKLPFVPMPGMSLVIDVKKDFYGTVKIKDVAWCVEQECFWITLESFDVDFDDEDPEGRDLSG